MDIQEFDKLIQNQKFDILKKEIENLIKNLQKTNKRFNKVLSQADAQQLEFVKMAEKIKLLLDNTSEGFLQFDENMSIDSEYSKQVEYIFGNSVKHKNITNLLYPNDKNKAKKLAENFLYVLNNPQQADLIFSLLNTEFTINNKFIEIEYKILPEKKLMAILRDITEKKELESKIEKENQILKMVVEVVVNKEQFLEIKDKYINFINNINNLDEEQLKREIHTFKGLFAQKELLVLPKKLHILESNLNINTDEMKAWLNEDMQILENILGKEFFSMDYILIDKKRLENISNKIKSYTNNKNIISLIESLKYFNISNYLRQYKNLLTQLSVKLEKPININFDIEDIYLSEKFKPFLDSLVHVFRNSIAHGIETLEERILSDKPEIGIITCKVYQKDYQLIIEISDDGRGIDIEKIRQTAVQKKLFTKTQIDFLSDKIVVDLIFNSGFSTNDSINSLSGRGVGLNVVKSELNKLNGKVDIFLKNGTTFIFSIPLNIDKVIFNFLQNCKVIEAFLEDKFEITQSEFKKLDNCFSIKIDGNIKGNLIISSNIDDEIIKEILNIIAGNFATRFYTEISIPHKKSITNSLPSIKFTNKNYDIYITFERLEYEN